MSGTAERILEAGRGLVGIPWHHLGRTREGVDCVGLVLLAYRAAGLELEDSRYPRGHRGPELLEHIARQGREVYAGAALPGDVLLFADGLHVCHLGLASTMHGEPAVIHAHLRRRRVREEPLSAGMGDLLRTAFRHPALEA